MPEINIELIGVASESSMARRELRRLMFRALPDELVDDAILLASELVSNVATYAPGPARLRAVLHDGTIRIEVEDSSRTVPIVHRGVPRPIGGHGLRLVDELADEWGVVVGGMGKTVWFVLGPR